MTVFRPLKQLIKPRELAKLLLSPIKQVQVITIIKIKSCKAAENK